MTRKTRVIVLPLSPEQLARFPTDVQSADASSAIIKPDPSPSAQQSEITGNQSDSNATPTPANGGDVNDSGLLAPPGADGKKKKGNGAIPGRKRAPPSIDPNAPPKERGRPGPKKKPRLPDGAIDRSQEKKGPVPGPNPNAAHKLGPKAHTGPINAGLRALDRTGKPCRKWERKGLVLKSFTGTVWGLNTWKAPPRENASNGEVKSDSAGSSEVRPTQGSSVAPSERSNGGNGAGATSMLGLESSPAPAVLA